VSPVCIVSQASILTGWNRRAATLPGQEDTEGFAALLDPNTLAGRALRVNLVTKGFGPLAFSPAEPSQPVYEEERRSRPLTVKPLGLLT